MCFFFLFQSDPRKLLPDLVGVFHPPKSRRHSADGNSGLCCSQAGPWPDHLHCQTLMVITDTQCLIPFVMDQKISL